MELLDNISKAISPITKSGADIIDKYTPVVTNYIRDNPLIVPASLGILLILNNRRRN